MHGFGKIIHPSGKTSQIEYSTSVNLKEIQSAVEGLIQMVPHFSSHERKPCVAFCNEEGKLKGLEFNREATMLWHEQLHESDRVDFLLGSVVIYWGDWQFMGSF